MRKWKKLLLSVLALGGLFLVITESGNVLAQQSDARLDGIVKDITFIKQTIAEQEKRLSDLEREIKEIREGSLSATPLDGKYIIVKGGGFRGQTITFTAKGSWIHSGGASGSYEITGDQIALTGLLGGVFQIQEEGHLLVGEFGGQTVRLEKQ